MKRTGKNWKLIWNGLQIELGTIQKKKFETGNSILDALSLYLLAGVDSDVDVSINAAFRGEINY